MKYLVSVTFKDDKAMQFEADNYYYDNDSYFFISQIKIHIIASDTFKHITIDKIF